MGGVQIQRTRGALGVDAGGGGNTAGARVRPDGRELTGLVEWVRCRHSSEEEKQYEEAEDDTIHSGQLTRCCHKTAMAAYEHTDQAKNAQCLSRPLQKHHDAHGEPVGPLVLGAGSDISVQGMNRLNR